MIGLSSQTFTKILAEKGIHPLDSKNDNIIYYLKNDYLIRRKSDWGVHMKLQLSVYPKEGVNRDKVVIVHFDLDIDGIIDNFEIVNKDELEEDITVFGYHKEEVDSTKIFTISNEDGGNIYIELNKDIKMNQLINCLLIDFKISLEHLGHKFLSLINLISYTSYPPFYTQPNSY